MEEKYMKSVMKKGIVMLVLVAFMFVMVSGIAYATDYSSMIDEIGQVEDGSNATESAKNIVGSILSIAKVIAVGVALIMLVVLAIKYMSAAPGDKAEIKKHAVVYVTGAIVLFGSAGILSIIEQFASTNITGD
jgi:hypothetical protein